MNMDKLVLKINSIDKYFGGLKAVNAFSLSVKKGEVVGIIGPNGSGKTTIFNIISGFLRADKGSMFLNGKEITNLAPHLRAHLGIGRLFQDVRIFKKLTLLENVLLARKNKIENPLDPFLKMNILKKERERALEDALRWLEFVGLKDKKDSLAESLSFGQQKLLALAIVLFSEPELLLLDEPLAGLDLKMKRKISELISELKKFGKTILVIEHLLDFVFDTSDRVVLLNNGTKVFDGDPKELRKNHLVMEVFTGNYAKQ
jgi:ABC-type branched-subunit amino acid transport system ATPase component